MATIHYILSVANRRWWAASVRDRTVTRRDLPRESKDAIESTAQRAAAALTELGYRGEGLCLALSADNVLTGRIDAGALPRRERRAAMVYRLEDELPVEAERLTADFLPAVAGRALGAAVETDRVRRLLDALSAHGIEAAAICCETLLAAWRACRNTADQADYVLVVGHDAVQLLRIAEGVPVGWQSAADAGELLRRLEADLLAQPLENLPPRVRVIGRPDDALCRALADGVGADITAATANPPAEDEAALAAAEQLAGRGAGWIDFCRDRLASGSLLERLSGYVKAAVLLAVALLGILAGLCLWRGERYRDLASRQEAAQRTVYRELSPQAGTQQNVLSRLRSDLKRLTAVSGHGADMPRRPDALETLRTVAASLPPQMRLRVTQLRIDPTAVVLHGEARTHGDAETIAAALKRQGLAADAPSTEHLVRGGVTFTLTAAPPAADNPASVQAASSPTPRPREGRP